MTHDIAGQRFSGTGRLAAHDEAWTQPWCKRNVAQRRRGGRAHGKERHAVPWGRRTGRSFVFGAESFLRLDASRDICFDGALAGDDHAAIRTGGVGVMRARTMQETVNKEILIDKLVGEDGERGDAILDLDLVAVCVCEIGKVMCHETRLVVNEFALASARC